ncbi:MAG: hypothetical protein ACKOWD_12765, partial [Rhodoferax sp.]
GTGHAGLLQAQAASATRCAGPGRSRPVSPGLREGPGIPAQGEQPVPGPANGPAVSAGCPIMNHLLSAQVLRCWHVLC